MRDVEIAAISEAIELICVEKRTRQSEQTLGREPQVTDLAQLAVDAHADRTARLQVQVRCPVLHRKAQEVVDLLQAEDVEAFAAAYGEALGDAYTAMGRIAEAQDAYQKVLMDPRSHRQEFALHRLFIILQVPRLLDTTKFICLTLKLMTINNTTWNPVHLSQVKISFVWIARLVKLV